MHLSITIVIIIITTLISIGGFTNHKILGDLVFYPPAVTEQNQWYRFITCGLVHADIAHLIFNMIALYFFGDSVEMIFKQLFGPIGGMIYLLLYVSALVISLLPTYFKHRHDYNYRSLGASGAVSAIVFAGLVLIPSAEVYLYFIPIPIPGFIFAPLYLLLSFILARKSRDNVNHSAHIWGSIYGALFVLVSCMVIGFPVIQNFSDQVIQYMHAKGWIH
jgi:membrane associated rhomboid family serine protease